MKNLLVIAALSATLAAPAIAQQAVLGTGTFSQSESSAAMIGTSVSGAGSIGPGTALSSNANSLVSTQNSAGFALAATTGATSGSTTGTTNTGATVSRNTSFSTSTGQAGGLSFGQNAGQAFNGSASNAFGGFGISLN